jgi:hypothetical protein
LLNFFVKASGSEGSQWCFGGVATKQSFAFVSAGFRGDTCGESVANGFGFGIDGAAEGFEDVERIGLGEDLERGTSGVTLVAEDSTAVDASENHGTGEIFGPGFHAAEWRD